MQYLSVAPGEDLLATGQCTRRGRSVHFAQAQAQAQAQACGAVSGKVVAAGQVAVSIAGERAGVPWQEPAPRAKEPVPRAKERVPRAN